MEIEKISVLGAGAMGHGKLRFVLKAAFKSSWKILRRNSFELGWRGSRSFFKAV